MTCGNCGNTAAYAIRSTYSDGRMNDVCDRCGGVTSVCNTPDVYFKEPYVDEHLSSEQYPGPKQISSRAEKAYWLKKCNLREGGDRKHGASSFDPISHRHAEESLRRTSNGR
jgi:hypothetical protein